MIASSPLLKMWLLGSLLCLFNPRVEGQPCVDGYRWQSGDIPGCGSIGSFGGCMNVNSCDQCAGYCDGYDDCQSYECSWHELKCNLNRQRWPSAQNVHTWNFCAKVNPRATCRNGYSERNGDVPGWNGYDVTHCDECAAKCDGEAWCNSYECSSTDLKCNLNSQTDPTVTENWRDYVFCSKNPPPPASHTCPWPSEGYFSQYASVPGAGSVNGVGGGMTVQSCEECTAACNADDDCLSYECSEHLHKCELNTRRWPTSGGASYYIMCSKVNYPSAQCRNGYRRLIGDVPGWDGIAVGHCDECAQLCDDAGEGSCLSYECSSTDLKCNLNAEHKPTYTGKDWNDYRFCAKVILEDCAEGYRLFDGDSHGSRLNTVGASDSAACGRLCDDSEDCLSYQFSQLDGECHLNSVRLPTSAWNNQDFNYCVKPAPTVPCAATYTLRTGDVPETGGIGYQGWGQEVSSCDACAELCTARDECLSYECSPTTLACNLNWDRLPLVPTPDHDAIFCSKPLSAANSQPSRTINCGSGFTRRTGSSSFPISLLSSDSGVRNLYTVGECRQACNNDPECKAFEWSRSFGGGVDPPCRLEFVLTRPGSPNQWQDYSFCSKD